MEQQLSTPELTPSPVKARTNLISVAGLKTKLYKPLVAMVVIGLVLRLVTMLLYFPTVLQWVDAARFSRVGGWHGLFSDYYMPAGYAAFLKLTHAIDANVAVTIAIQHLLGLVSGVLIYMAIRRVGGPRWLGLFPAAVSLLVGDHIFLEHLLMNDAFFEFAVVAGLFLAIRALVPQPNPKRLVIASIALGLTGLIRQTGLALPAVLTLCTMIGAGVPPRLRLKLAVLAALPALVVVGGYIGLAHAFGRYTGLTDMSGWNLYARVAPIADCHKFTPPPGTHILCEATPPDQRDGSFYYAWEHSSRGQAVLGSATPANESKPGRFAKAVILGQPLDYVQLVLKEIGRYGDPNLGAQRPLSGDPPEEVSFGFNDLETQRELLTAMGSYWHDLKPREHAIAVLTDYQTVTRIIGLVWWLLVALTAAGMVLARGSARLASWLFGLSALSLYALPAMTLSWDWRYGIPPQVPLVAAATCATLGIWQRWSHSQKSSSPQATRNEVVAERPSEGAGPATCATSSPLGRRR
jgi:hypothetical protein